MFFSRIAAASLFFLSATTFVSAAPTLRTREVKRLDVDSEVQTVLTTLKTTTDGVLPQITALVGDVSEEVLTPLLQEVVTALETATASLGAISPSGVTGDHDAVAQVLTGVLTDVSNTLAPIISDVLSIPAVKDLLQSTVNPLLNTILNTVNGLLPGVLPVVVGLLGDVTGILSSLGLGSVVGTLVSV